MSLPLLPSLTCDDALMPNEIVRLSNAVQTRSKLLLPPGWDTQRHAYLTPMHWMQDRTIPYLDHMPLLLTNTAATRSCALAPTPQLLPPAGGQVLRHFCPDLAQQRLDLSGSLQGAEPTDCDLVVIVTS